MPKNNVRHHNNCSRCPIVGAEDLPTEEVYQLLSLRFSIRIANELARNLDPVEADTATLRRWLQLTKIDRTHIDHLPANLGPGLVATLPSGCGTPLIDGNHRGARSLRDEEAFFVRVLPEAETLELLRRSMGSATADHWWERMRDSEPHPKDVEKAE
jgi:hypothetical protein